MTRVEVLMESAPAILYLTAQQAEAMVKAGKRLASDTAWWGDGDNLVERQVIRCTRHGSDTWDVRVVDAVGLIAVGDLQLEVLPKIPLAHLLYLFGHSGRFPRLADEAVGSAVGQSLWELAARWFLIEMERLLRKDLLRGYEAETDWLRVVRGRADTVATSRSLASGRLEALCTFEDFTIDTPWNRVLLEATRRVSQSALLPWSERKRALGVRQRLEGVGALQPQDLRVPLERRAHYYRSAVRLAIHIIQGHARTIEHGSHEAWTFLIRTPPMVEDGLRNVLRDHLGGRWGTAKSSKQLRGSTMTVNPDIVVDGGLAIADVKYKLAQSEWRRADLYQAIAFAVAFESRDAALIGFDGSSKVWKPDVQIGDIRVRDLSWNADPDMDPKDSGHLIASQMGRWLTDIETSKH